MSEENKPIDTKPEPVTKEPAAQIVVEDMALLKSKNIRLEAMVDELTKKLQEKMAESDQYKAHVEQSAKAELLAYIEPRYDMAPELLMLKDFEELKGIKAVIDKVNGFSFKAGTPVTYDKKSNPRAELASVHDKYMAKIGGNK